MEGKSGILPFLGQFVHGRTFDSGRSHGPTFALCSLCVDAFAAHTMKEKVAGLNPYFLCDDSRYWQAGLDMLVQVREGLC